MPPGIALTLLVLALLPAAEAMEARGMVFIVGGVGRLDTLGPVAKRTLPKAGVGHEVREFIWGNGFGKVLEDLQATQHQETKAAELAEQITRYRQLHPRRPIYLVARSGGTGIALLATQRLPPQTLERLVLIAPAVSPSYDLRPALRATRQEVVNYYSKVDRLVLGWGTSIFGTMDRVYGPGAGMVGFNRPKEDAQLYDRLIQIHWSLEMIKSGHTGGHINTSLPRFVSHELPKWLK